MFLILSCGRSVRRVPIGKEPLTIGRSPDCGLTLNDSELSRNHCRVQEVSPQRVEISDLASTNGSYVNGSRVETRPLCAGDTIQLGESLLLVGEEKASTPATPDEATAISEAPELEPAAMVREIILRLYLMNSESETDFDVDQLLETVLHGILDATGFERGLLLLPDQPGTFRTILGRGADHRPLGPEKQSYSRTVIREALRRRTDVSVVEQGEPEYSGQISLRRTGARSTLCLPLVPPQRSTKSEGNDSRKRFAADYIPGFVYLDSRLGSPEVSSQVTQLLRALAIHAAVALENSYLLRQANTDSLTGLLNRAAFERILSSEVERQTSADGQLAVVMLDVDHFKAVNDNFGHPVGDEVLAEIARRIQDSVRSTDFVARYGGEEFVLCLCNADSTAAGRLCERIRLAISESPISTHSLQVTLSQGFAVLARGSKLEPKALISRADEALYEAKRAGRDRVLEWLQRTRPAKTRKHDRSRLQHSLPKIELLAPKAATSSPEPQSPFERLRSDLLCVLDPDFILSELEGPWHAATGWSVQKLAGRAFESLIKREDRQLFRSFAASLEAPEQTSDSDLRVLRRDGSHFWARFVGHLVAEQIALRVEDVTELRKLRRRMTGTERRAAKLVMAESSMREARDRAEQLSHAKSAFVANMSHELRTPLNAILGFSELLSVTQFGPLTPKQARFTANISESGQHLLKLINELLDLAKIEAGRTTLQLSASGLDEAIKKSSATVESLVQKNDLQFDLSVSEELPKTSVDPLRFEQILLNLLGNAVKFTAPGGRVLLDVTTAQRERPGGPWIKVSVSDSGPGLSASELETIFEAFEQAQHSSKIHFNGTGLGLTLARHLVLLHGGEIWGESPAFEDCGTRFVVLIPSDAARVAQAQQPASPALAAQQGRAHSIPAPGGTDRKTALVIADEDAHELLSGFLLSGGLNVAFSTVEEFSISRIQELRPDLVVIEINGPEGTLGSKLDELEGNRKTLMIPILVVSSHDMEHRLGAHKPQGWIVKPFTQDEFLRAVDQVLDIGCRS